jgi:undecaprenyl-diphosphatase
MSDRVLDLVGFVLLLGAAITLSILAATNDTLPGDRGITDWLQDRSLPGDALSDAVRLITGTEIVLATGTALAGVLWLRGYRRQAVLLAAGLVALAVLQPAVKELVGRPRPSPELVEVRAGGSSPSFPSGHVMSGAFLYGALLYFALTLPLARLPAVLLAAFCAIVIVLSAPVNVWLGVHWPTDVLGGWLWAAILLLPLVVIDTYERAPD